MNSTSNQLLGSILTTLTKIETKVGINTNNSAVITSGTTKGVNNTQQQPKTSKTNPLLLMSGALMMPSIVKKTKGLNTNKDVKYFTKFVDTMVSLTTKANDVADKYAISNLLNGIFKDSKDLFKNISQFAKLEKKGIINIAVKGLTHFIESVSSLSSKINSSDNDKISNMGKSISRPIKDISIALLGFSASLILIGGSFIIANKLLGFGTNIGVFASTLLGISVTMVAFAGTIALIGKLNSSVESGLQVVNDIGMGLLTFTSSLLIMGASMLIINAITGSPLATFGIFGGALLGVSTSLFVFAGTIAMISLISKGVEGGLKVVNGIGTSLLGLTGSMVLMAFSMVALNALTNNPFATAGAFLGGFIMVASGLLVLGGVMGLLGTIKPLTEKGESSIKGMAVSILAMSASLVIAGGLMFGATYLEMGEYKSTPIIIGVSLLAMGGMFALIGSMGGRIKSGALSIGIMSLSMLSFGVVLWTSAKLFQDVFNSSKTWQDNLSGSIGILAVVGGIVGMATLYSSVIAPMTPFIIAASSGVIIMASSIYLTMKSIEKSMDIVGNVDKSFGSNMTNAIGGFIGGIWNGFKKGFGITSDKGIIDGIFSTAKAGGKMAIMMAGSGLMMALSLSMITFSKALSYFGRNGNITLYDVDGNGNFTTGKTINTIQASSSIGTAITTFLTTISDAVGSIKYDNVIKISETLLGSSSASFLGMNIKPKPGILDAAMKFASMLEKFAGKKGDFIIYDTETKKSKTVSMVDISKNIAQGITTFFNTLIDGIKPLSSPDEYKKVEDMALLLLGKKESNILGILGVKSDKIGILEPVIKFADIVEKLGKGTYTYVDENGETRTANLNMDGSSIAEKIINFSNALMKGLSDGTFENGKSKGFDNFTQFIDNLSERLDKVEKIANSIDVMASATERLVNSINDLNASKFDILNKTLSPKSSNSNDSSEPIIKTSNQQSSSNNINNNVNNNDFSDIVASKVMSAFGTKTFTFHFIESTKGMLKFT